MAINKNNKKDNETNNTTNLSDEIQVKTNEESNNTNVIEENAQGDDTATQSDNTVTCLFLVNVKYGKDVKSIGESITLEEDEALFLEENEIVQIVR